MCSPTTESIIRHAFVLEDDLEAIKPPNSGIESEECGKIKISSPTSDKMHQVSLSQSPFTPQSSPPPSVDGKSLEDRLIDELFGENNDHSSSANRTSKEYREVIRGSNISTTPQSFSQSKLLNLELPNCFSPIPFKPRKGAQEISSIEITDAAFLQKFARVYDELMVYIDFSNAQLLLYSSSQRAILADSIDFFLSNIDRVNKENDNYQILFDVICTRFTTAEFTNYFTEKYL